MDECGKIAGVTTRPKDQLPSTNSNRLIERNTIFCGIRGWKGWAWPLAVIGTNSIAAYLIAHLWDGFIERALVTHLSARIFQTFGAGFEQLLKDAAILLVLWLFLAWMERRKIFLRV